MTREAESSGMEGGRKSFFERLRRDRRGSVPVEFALLAIPFCMLVFAILESCISFAAQEVLANATDDVARMMRTGQIKTADVDKKPAALKKLLCDRMTLIFPTDCPGLEADLQTYTTFQAAASVRTKFTGTGKNQDIDTNGFANVTLGPSMSKNMLRVFYRWPVFTDLLATSMSNLKGGKTLHFASVTWQNEPFDD